LSGLFGNPAALVVAAPVLSAGMMTRVPEARQRLAFALCLLLIGWLGGFLSLALVDPFTINALQAAGEGERLDALAAGGASRGRDGVLADVNNAPAFVLGRSNAGGILSPQSEAFVLAQLFGRVETPFVAVPDPQSTTGANDRLDTAFPSLFRDGLPGYRLIYQNNTWRLFSREKKEPVSKE